VNSTVNSRDFPRIYLTWRNLGHQTIRGREVSIRAAIFFDNSVLCLKSTRFKRQTENDSYCRFSTDLVTLPELRFEDFFLLANITFVLAICFKM
jgi:hypothetical protein